MEKERKAAGRKEAGFSILDILITVLRRKRPILAATLGFAAAAALISCLMHPVYRAECRVLPPEKEIPVIGDRADVPLAVEAERARNEMYVGVIESRTVLTRIMDEFGLMKAYGEKYRSDALKKLGGNIKARLGRDGIISIEVDDEDPRRAAGMANSLVLAANGVLLENSSESAGKRRIYYENKLHEIKEDLAKAEGELKAYEEKTGAVELEEQEKAVIKSAALLKSQIAAKEIALGAMRAYATPGNPDFQALREEIAAMKQQLAKMEAKGAENRADTVPPAGGLPSIGVEYERRIREVKYQEALFNIIARQYELARVDETSGFGTLQVLDRAVPPDKRQRPKRALMTAMAGATGFVFSLFVAFFLDFLENARREDHRRFGQLVKNLQFRR
ncbi:MAG: Wzz/FepE/Etk N-terminal domain-containing protein [Nitrospiraceae bacterium]|nr:Wzz/FepE/Etk N-terminal domain-containing protein [Nitrospiraceae bacterium]